MIEIKTKNGNYMQKRTVNVRDYAGEEIGLICVFPDIEYQRIEGFGGAFTEAAATTIDKLSDKKRAEIIKLYFDKNDGIGYNFGRVHMGSSDFSLGNYSCVEEGDRELKTFNIERDKKSVIPMVKDAMKYGDIRVLVSPWSPPAFMKTNGERNRGGKLKREYFDAWAQHFVKFIEAYRAEGIDIKYASVQNEPKATQTWDSCVYSAEEERDFVINYLGERMQKLGVKLLFWDHNKENMLNRARVMLDSDASKYIDGIAFHWYSGDHFEQLSMFNKLYPEKSLVFSEGCYEYSLGAPDTVKIGERYAHDMIGNFNAGCSIFCDWNLVLDEKGGPNHVGNFCDAPIMADTQNDRVEIHDSYYYIGHMSKFVASGAVRVGSSKWSSKIDTVSFKNPNGEIVTIVLNSGDEDLNASIVLDNKIAEINIEAHSIATYII